MGKISDLFKRKPVRLTEEQYLEKLLKKGLKADGTVDLDPQPLEPPIGYKRAPSMVEVVREQIRSERLAVAAAEAGMETFEESEDFDVDDDPYPRMSGYENDFDPTIDEVKEGVEAARNEKKEKEEAERLAAEKAREADELAEFARLTDKFGKD